MKRYVTPSKKKRRNKEETDFISCIQKQGNSVYRLTVRYCIDQMLSTTYRNKNVTLSVNIT